MYLRVSSTSSRSRSSDAHIDALSRVNVDGAGVPGQWEPAAKCPECGREFDRPLLSGPTADGHTALQGRASLGQYVASQKSTRRSHRRDPRALPAQASAHATVP